jgi:hypothetical protein
MILELDIPGLDKREQGTCALIARYHTKAPPDASRHRGFASLETGRRLSNGSPGCCASPTVSTAATPGPLRGWRAR